MGFYTSWKYYKDTEHVDNNTAAILALCGVIDEFNSMFYCAFIDNPLKPTKREEPETEDIPDPPNINVTVNGQPVPMHIPNEAIKNIQQEFNLTGNLGTTVSEPRIRPAPPCMKNM